MVVGLLMGCCRCVGGCDEPRGYQGRAAAFVSHISGSHSGIVGLPMFETAALLARFRVVPR